jgi:D-hexose-6-phosphate mutarotase
MTDGQSVAALEERFGIRGAVRFGTGPGGLVRAEVRTPRAEATVYLLGAHVTRYQPAGDVPMLFTSASSRFQAGHPIRGGVPIVFPWFGPCRDEASAPMHGFARIADWRLVAARQEAEGSVVLTLGVDDTLATHSVWPHAYAASYTIRIGKALDLTLDVANRSDRPVLYEEALHTYLAVRDIGTVAVRGLAGLPYIDKTDGMRRTVQESDPLRVAAETDRVYLGARGTVIVEDAASGRRLIVEQQGSGATVVWNPWIAKAKAMPDFGDDEWRGMLCIETANAADHAVRLPAGARHTLRATLHSEPL